MKPPTVKTHSLSTVYLDREPVGLLGDPNPNVSKILVAVGLKPEDVLLLRARSADDSHGIPLSPGDSLDRTAEPTTPIYLTSAAKTPTSPPSSKAARRTTDGTNPNPTAPPTR